MKTIPTLTWYLEMVQKPEQSAELPVGFRIRLWDPNITEYLALYKSVGGKYNWYDRILMQPQRLTEILRSEHTEILLLESNDKQAGFAELDHSVQGETELVYFGLTDEFTGRGAGYPFLRKVIEHVWSSEPAEHNAINRLWLHTCDLDHPAALPLYQKAGFIVYKTETIMQPINLG